MGYYIFSICCRDNYLNLSMLFSACSWGYSYEEQGTVINDDAPVNNAQQCLNRCNAMQQCKFWDFGNNHCRLYSDVFDGPEADELYEFGTKNCVYGMITVILLLSNIYLNLINIIHSLLISKIVNILRRVSVEFS